MLGQPPLVVVSLCKYCLILYIFYYHVNAMLYCFILHIWRAARIYLYPRLIIQTEHTNHLRDNNSLHHAVTQRDLLSRIQSNNKPNWIFRQFLRLDLTCIYPGSMKHE